MAIPTTATPNVGGESRLLIDGTTLNLINNASGRAILQFNGSPTAADNNWIGGLLSSGPSSISGQAPSGPPVAEQASATFLAQFLTAVGNIEIRNSIINGTNNASGGMIVLINNAPQRYNSNPASIPEQERTPNSPVGTDDSRVNRRGPTGPQSGPSPPAANSL